MSEVPNVEMSALRFRDSREPGTPPGYLHDVPDAPRAELSVFAYDETDSVEETLESVEQLDELQSEWETVWLNVDGLGDAETLRGVGEVFDLSALVLEDIQHAPQRPRCQVLEESMFLTTLMPRPEDDPIAIEQVSIVFGPGHVVTFQQFVGGDVLDPIRRRIRDGSGRMRERRADYLAYAILDAIVDSYLPILEAYDRELTRYELEVLEGQRADVATDVYEFKRSIMELERATRPQLHMVQALPRTGADFFEAQTRPYLRDCIDHADQANELAGAARQTASSLLELHLSLASQKMNEVMKILTMIATIFIPLTFVAGVYGMNFNPAASPWNMPELNWKYGYPATLAVMAVIMVGMIVYFVRKGWLGSRR